MRANDVKNQTFKQKLNGYDKQEVQNFQNEVLQAIESLEASNQHLQQELYNANQKLEEFLGKEETLNRSIIVAQEAADRLRENALNEAELIITQAEAEAERLLTEAASKATVVNTETDQLQQVARTFLHQTLGLLNFTKDALEDSRWDIILSDTPIGKVETPTLDEVLAKYQLPLRNNEGEAVFLTEQEAAERAQELETQGKAGQASFDNDKPAVFPEEVAAPDDLAGAVNMAETDLTAVENDTDEA